MAEARRTALADLEHPELFLEAVCTAAFFELVSKLADSTGRPAHPPAAAIVLNISFTIMGVMYGIYCWLHRLVFGC